MVDSLKFSAAHWKELRVDVAASAGRGVLTLQANRALHLHPRGLLVARTHAALAIGPLSIRSRLDGE